MIELRCVRSGPGRRYTCRNFLTASLNTAMFDGALLPDTEMGFVLSEYSQTRDVSEFLNKTRGQALVRERSGTDGNPR